MAEFEEEERETDDQLAEVIETGTRTGANPAATPKATRKPAKILVPLVQFVPFVL
jgi:hypothetical protein